MIAALLGRHFWIPAYIALGLGLWMPGSYPWLKPFVPIALGSILFFTCLKIPLRDVAAGVRDRALMRRTGWMAAAKLLALPAAAWAITWLVSPFWAPGVALVCLMPAGLSSVALTDLHRGDRVLALFLILVTSILAPLSVPLGMALVHPGSSPDAAQLSGQAAYILAMLAIPFTLAQGVRAAVPKVVERGMAWWGRLSILSLVAMILVSCLANRAAWDGWSPLQMLAPLGFAVLASCLFLGIALAMRRLLPVPAVTAFACASLYMNNGLSIAYATRFHPGDAAVMLPCVLMQVPMVGMVVLWGFWAHSGDDEPAPT